MRKELKNIDDFRGKFSGTFSRFGQKINWNGFPETTLLLINIKDSNNNIICDHLWFNLTKKFEKLGELKEGDNIEFEARVSEYYKGYINHREGIHEKELDYKLSYPSKIKKI